MNKFATIAALALIVTTMTSHAFTPATRVAGTSNMQVSSMATASDLPYFIDVNERQQEGFKNDPTPSRRAADTIEAAPKKRAAPKSANKGKGGAVHKQGIFSPAVLAAKAVLGDEQLNKIRAKAISMHSDVIKNFVDTYELPTGQAALKRLFTICDKDGNGIITEDELNDGLRSLGFTWLKEKQVKGILERADTDDNGAIDYEEFKNEAPKTLRTNLVKLAKQNGGELGFLV
jgi:hypothetical protein